MLLLDESRESISVDAPVSGHPSVDAGVDTADIDPDESLDWSQELLCQIHLTNILLLTKNKTIYLNYQEIWRQKPL